MTPTPTPALTDEQIDAAIEEVIYGYAFNRGGGPGRQFVTDTIAAVIARAKREERERIGDKFDERRCSVARCTCCGIAAGTITEADHA